MTDQSSSVNRREFMMTAAAAAPVVGQAVERAAPRPPGGRLKVALVGTGIRGISLWGKTLHSKYGDVVEFGGLCDINPKRMAFARDYIGLSCPMFTDFDEMIRVVVPDRVIVTTIDCFHGKYICRAMDLGIDVISEKPLATDERMIQDIAKTLYRTGRRLIITHNFRYSPEAETIKKILDSGEIGIVTSVDFNYYLDTDHGASYFRRWHGFKQFNGSLLVTKSCHHFDLVRWWLGADPVEVHAYGALRRFGFNGEYRSERCITCNWKSRCEWFWDVTKDSLSMDLYVKAESEDGYLRDACVYRSDINVWDTMSLNVRYDSGVMMSYSLNSFMPHEGYRVSFNGTKGRLDARVYHRQPWKVDGLAEIRVTPLFGESRTLIVREGGGDGHWGSDTKMLDMILRGPRPDPLHQLATPREGALACLVGIAARRSIESRRIVAIEELV